MTAGQSGRLIDWWSVCMQDIFGFIFAQREEVETCRPSLLMSKVHPDRVASMAPDEDFTVIKGVWLIESPQFPSSVSIISFCACAQLLLIIPLTTTPPDKFCPPISIPSFPSPSPLPHPKLRASDVESLDLYSWRQTTKLPFFLYSYVSLLSTHLSFHSVWITLTLTSPLILCTIFHFIIQLMP